MAVVRDSDLIHASILRLRQQAAWYRNRLQETADKLAVLETALAGKQTAKAQQDQAEGPSTSPAADEEKSAP